MQYLHKIAHCQKQKRAKWNTRMIKCLVREIFIILFASVLVIISFPMSEKLSTLLPPIPWEYCVFLSFVPLFYLHQDQKLGHVFRTGYLFGIVYYFGTLSWVVLTMINYGNMSGILSYLVLTALVLYLALYTGLFFVFNKALTNRFNIPYCLVAPFIWVLLEYHRSIIITGFPWNLLGYTQYRQILLIQIADYVGVYGVSFLIIFVNCWVYDIIFGNHTRRIKYYLSIAVSSIILCSLTYGWFQLTRPQTGETVMICLIQGNYRQEEKWVPGMKQKTLDTYIQLSKSTFNRNPDLVVWPEAATPFRLRYSAVSYTKIAKLARACDCDLLIGSPDLEGTEDNARYLNSAFHINKNGELAGRYDKMHLVPFGEYIPLNKYLFFVEKMTQGASGDFSAGTTPTVFNGAATPFGVYICYETIFPDQLRRFVLNGARYLVSITNDAWFGRSAASFQHFSMTIFRAIENRCPVVRAANTGITGIIDLNGKIVAKTSIFERTTLCGDISIESRRTLTFYTRYGDFFVLLCSFYVFVIGILSLLMSREHY